MLMTTDDELILLSAFRYALGRQTYVPKVVATRIKRDWPKLSDRTQEMIHREITEADIDGRLGMDMDAVVWRDVIKSTKPRTH